MKLKKILAISLASVSMVVSSTSVLAEHTTLDGYGQEWDDYSYTANQKFKDVPPSHWAFKAIDRVVNKGWFSGYADGTFHPNDVITRAEAVTVFMNFTGVQPQNVTETSFTDVSPSDWYAPYIEAGKDYLPLRTTYMGTNPFLPNQPVTREDVCYGLVKIKGYESDTQYANRFVLNMFSDQNSISDDVKPYVVVAVEKKLISGYDDGTLGAQDPLTRAEFATMLYRASYVGTNG